MLPCRRKRLSCVYFPEGSRSDHITGLGCSSTEEAKPVPMTQPAGGHPRQALPATPPRTSQNVWVPPGQQTMERLPFRISNPELDVFQDTQKESLWPMSRHRVAEQEGPEIIT